MGRKTWQSGKKGGQEIQSWALGFSLPPGDGATERLVTWQPDLPSPSSPSSPGPECHKVHAREASGSSPGKATLTCPVSSFLPGARVRDELPPSACVTEPWRQQQEGVVLMEESRLCKPLRS